MLPEATSYEQLQARFRWQIPSRFNMGVACCDAHADGSGAPALICDEADGRSRVWSYDALKQASNRLANLLESRGVQRGDRVAILIGQQVETLLAHLAAYKLGAIALPLFALFGPEALEYRLADSGAKVLVTNQAGLAAVAPLRERLPALDTLLVTDEASGESALWPLLERASDRFTPLDSTADDPALLIYTSGTTGQPKGALHAHRVLLGHLPGVQMPQELFPRPGDRFWTPADWAWIGGLLDVLLPSLYFGVPVVAGSGGKFDPEQAVRLMARHEVRNVFLPPTALRLMRRDAVSPGEAGARLRSIGSGGERLGDDLVHWVEGAFGCPINEFYGQTEANLLVASCRALFPRRSGAMGRAVPGHALAVLGEEGLPLAPGETGIIAVRRPDPVMFLAYWNRPDATREKFRGDWLLTGDLGRIDGQGYLTYVGREDDIINSAGYRIGPAEIEECIARHEAVALCAVVGVPDALRGERVKACIVLQPGVSPSDALAAEIQSFVKSRLAAHEYPREIAFLPSLPLTATGKVRRNELKGTSAGHRGGPSS